MFYTQSAVCGPQSIVHSPQSMFYTNTNINFITETDYVLPLPKLIDAWLIAKTGDARQAWKIHALLIITLPMQNSYKTKQTKKDNGIMMG